MRPQGTSVLQGREDVSKVFLLGGPHDGKLIEWAHPPKGPEA